MAGAQNQFCCNLYLEKDVHNANDATLCPAVSWCLRTHPPLVYFSGFKSPTFVTQQVRFEFMYHLRIFGGKHSKFKGATANNLNVSISKYVFPPHVFFIISSIAIHMAE